MNDAVFATLEKFKDQLDPERLKMPSLPDVAVRVQQLASNPNATPEQLAALISDDAALSAQMIRIANSPLMRHLSEVRSVLQAVTRLGFGLVCNMTLVFAVKNALKVRTSFVSRELARTWVESREIAAIASALAGLTRKLPPDQALLAGMVHRIGVLPLLAALDEMTLEPEEYPAAIAAIEELHPDLGSRLLRDWHFSEDLACVPETHRNPCRPGEGAPDLADVVAVAFVVHKIAEGQTEWIPPMESLESGARLGLDCSVEALELIANDERVEQSRELLS